MSELQIVDDLTERLGISSDQAEAAVGTCLHLIRGHCSDQGFDVIQQCIPEADQWMNACVAAGAEPTPPRPPDDNDLASNEDEGVREAYQASKWDPTGGMGAVVEEVESVFGGASKGKHVGALAGLIAGFKTLGMESSAAAEAGPPLVAFLHERLGDDGFASLVGEVPMLKHLATGGTNSFTDSFGHRLSKFFLHHRE